MEPIDLEPGLHAFRCPVSNGVWIPADSYWRWQESLEKLPHPKSPPPQVEHRDENDDSEEAKTRARRALLCPESGALLVRYRAGSGLNIHIEHSPITGSIWLDEGEWDILKQAGLHRELHVIFSSAYQHKISRQETKSRLEELFVERLGEADAHRVRKFAEFLAMHPRKREIVAYLMNS